jgi:succinate dehydrogenase/fumarate reductase flavoprotein subunit
LKLKMETMQTDVLIVGGGIAGLMAAINASAGGADVIVAEKANTKRSGSGATGNDHFCCYIPEVHGDDIEPIIEEDLNSLHGKAQDMDLVVKFLEKSGEMAKTWHEWGINMQPHGDWEYNGHAFPGRPRIFLKYAGENQKSVLTKQAKKAGAKIYNHLPIVDVLVKDGEVAGALGIYIKSDEPELRLIKAKAVILGTGTANRLYPPAASPGYIFNIAFCPACTGAGRAAAYRAGARLVNMEMPNRHAGPKYFSRCGKATWIGIYRDPHGKAIGPFVEKPTRELGDITADVWNSVFSDMMKDGSGPPYMDCTQTAEDDIDYMLWGLKQEGNTAMLDYMAKEGIDVREYMVEFMQYEPFLIGGRGIDIDADGATSIPGLYAAGDEVGNFRADMSGAATYGWFAGAHAAKRAAQKDGWADIDSADRIEERRDLIDNFMSRSNGASWLEANLTLQQIMKDYAGVEVRSETLLKAGLKYLGDLRRKAMATMAADDSHQLMRCFEALDLMDCGEIIMHSALERKETRERHIRSDFPFTNPLLADKFVTIERKSGEANTGWRLKK